MFVMRRDGPVF